MFVLEEATLTRKARASQVSHVDSERTPKIIESQSSSNLKKSASKNIHYETSHKLKSRDC